MKKILLIFAVSIFFVVGCNGGGGIELGSGGSGSIIPGSGGGSTGGDSGGSGSGGGSGGSPDIPVIVPTGIFFTPTPSDPIELNLSGTKAYQLSVKVEPTGTVCNNLSYSSSNASVASVDGNGLITALSVGEAVIRWMVTNIILRFML